MTAALDAALQQLHELRLFCDFQDRLPDVPVTFPQDPAAAAGIAAMWNGLGVVGVWAALEAFAVAHQRRAADIPKALIGQVAALQPTWWELDDLRHLYAHNFAGVAEASYFARRHTKKQTPHALQQGVAVGLDSGAYFDGTRVAVTGEHLRF
jgi:hypothetical protein